MKSIKFLFAMLVTVACESTVEVEFPRETPKLVLNALLEADSAVIVELSQSKSVLSDGELTVVKEAQVVLLENNRPVATLTEAQSGIWGTYATDFTLSAEAIYTVEASKEGFEPVTATTSIPAAVPIETLGYDKEVVREGDPRFDTKDNAPDPQLVVNNLRLSFNDPAEEANYYEIQVYEDHTSYYRKEDSTSPTQVWEAALITSSDPVVVNNDVLQGDTHYTGSSLIFSDEIFNGQRYTVAFDTDRDFDTFRRTDRYRVLFRHISEEQFRYWQSAKQQYRAEDDPFAEPVLIFNNVVGGYGIVGGANTQSELITTE